MVIQENAWRSLKSYINRIEVTHVYYDISELPVPVPEEVLLSQKNKYSTKWDLHINGQLFNTAVHQLDNLISSFHHEVENNLGLNLHKNLITNYFHDIILTLNEIMDKRLVNLDNSFDYDGLSYHSDFEQYGLFRERFGDPKITFLPILNERIVDLELFLLTKDEYKDLKKRLNKSPLGNDKINWKDNVNQLVNFYLNQIKDGLIESDTKNLAAFLINNFNWNNKPLSESTIKTYLDPNKAIEDLPKNHKEIDYKDFLKD